MTKPSTDYLNNKNRTFVIAEAGSNWRTKDLKSSIKRAKKMISIAAKSGADAIKFQTYSSDRVYVPKAGNSNYLTKSGINKSINQIFDEFSMPHHVLGVLNKFCKKQKIRFMSTPFSVDDAKAVNKFVKIHKIASYEINHVPLLKFLASTKKPIIISTGAATYEKIDFAIKILKKHGTKQICILQCTAAYPAPMDSLNIASIPKLRDKFKIPVGFSDHSIEPIIAPLLAIGYGATIIEKHFTLNRKFSGPDHAFALEPSELEMLVNSVRKADTAKGTGKKSVEKIERELKKFATRSIQATMEIQVGDRLELDKNIELLRPGKRSRGEDAIKIDKINGKVSRRRIHRGDGIKSSYVSN